MQNVLNLRGHYNLQDMEETLTETVSKMISDHPDIGAFVLECTELAIHAHAIQDATRLPVWDFSTLVNWLQSGAVRRPFSGWI